MYTVLSLQVMLLYLNFNPSHLDCEEPTVFCYQVFLSILSYTNQKII